MPKQAQETDGPVLPELPDRDRIARRFAPQFELCDRLHALVWDEQPDARKVGDERQIVLLAILNRSLDTYDAAVSLCRFGRPLQALMLARGLFEDMVAAFWASVPANHEKALQRIRDQEDHQVLLANDTIRDYPHRFLLEADDHPDLEARRTAFNRTFGPYGGKTWFGDIHSALKKISPLWDELGGESETLFVYYAVVHRHINLQLHNTVSGIKRSLDHYGDSSRVDDDEIDVALRACFFCLQGLTHLVFRETVVARVRLQALEEESHRVFTDMTPMKRTRFGRNDPCWCGSGRKLKKCHGE